MVLVYAESPGGELKKAAFEAVTYGKKTAEVLGTECIAITLGSNVGNAGQLGKYGASKVYNLSSANLDNFDSQVFSKVLAKAAQDLGADTVIVSHTSSGKSILGRLAVLLSAGSVPGVNALPTNDGSFKVSKGVFSGKAIATYEIKTATRVLSLMGNALPPEASGAEVGVEAMSMDVPASRLKTSLSKQESEMAPLPEAELVVSGGRGLKGPENWGILLDLAKELGATTACSRPVADTGWRPHHEHVGQTGVAIRPNLYIAVAISGAIQHLAGVNSSKVIVVINKDPEAPFFKAADYGVVGDAFEVLPRLTAALQK